MKIAQNFDEYPEMMTVRETSEFLRIPCPTVYYLINKDKLPAIRISGRWRIRRSEIETVLKIKSPKRKEAAAPTILAIEDDPGHQKLYEMFLGNLGCKTVLADSGKSGLEEARKSRIDMVFLDLQLPDMPGDEVYKGLKNIDPDLPVVIATGFPDSDMLERILADGPVLVLRKPLDLDLLRKATGFFPFVNQEESVVAASAA